MSEATLLDVIATKAAERLELRHQQEGGVHALVYSFDDGRTQLVTLSSIQGWSGRDTVLVYSIVGPYSDDLDLRPLLGSITTATFARVCMVQKKYLAVAATLDFEEIDLPRLVVSLELRIKEVALFADNFEQDLFGADVF